MPQRHFETERKLDGMRGFWLLGISFFGLEKAVQQMSLLHPLVPQQLLRHCDFKSLQHRSLFPEKLLT